MSIRKTLLGEGLQVIDSCRICKSQPESRIHQAFHGYLGSEHIPLLPLRRATGKVPTLLLLVEHRPE